MFKKLTRHGNSLALIIDRPVLELLNIDKETPLEISTYGRSLIVSPVQDEVRSRQFQEKLAEVNRKYGRSLKNLAD